MKKNKAYHYFRFLLKAFLVFSIFIFLFRGPIFRSSIYYTSIGKRPLQKIKDPSLIQELNTIDPQQIKDIDDIIRTARRITRRNLSFSSYASSNNPNLVYQTGKANCIGYSALFNSIANYLIETQKLENKYRAIHLIGRLDFLGIDLHQFFDDPFLQDHDFNGIENLENGERIYIDPSLSDYFRINYVNEMSK